MTDREFVESEREFPIAVTAKESGMVAIVDTLKFLSLWRYSEDEAWREAATSIRDLAVIG